MKNLVLWVLMLGLIFANLPSQAQLDGIAGVEPIPTVTGKKVEQLYPAHVDAHNGRNLAPEGVVDMRLTGVKSHVPVSVHEEVTIAKLRFAGTYVAKFLGITFETVDQLDQWFEDNSTLGNRAAWHRNLYGNKKYLLVDKTQPGLEIQTVGYLKTKEGYEPRFKNRPLYLEGQRGYLEDEIIMVLSLEELFPHFAFCKGVFTPWLSLGCGNDVLAVDPIVFAQQQKNTPAPLPAPVIIEPVVAAQPVFGAQWGVQTVFVQHWIQPLPVMTPIWSCGMMFFNPCWNCGWVNRPCGGTWGGNTYNYTTNNWYTQNGQPAGDINIDIDIDNTNTNTNNNGNVGGGDGGDVADDGGPVNPPDVGGNGGGVNPPDVGGGPVSAENGGRSLEIESAFESALAEYKQPETVSVEDSHLEQEQHSLTETQRSPEREVATVSKPEANHSQNITSLESVMSEYQSVGGTFESSLAEYKQPEIFTEEVFSQTPASDSELKTPTIASTEVYGNRAPQQSLDNLYEQVTGLKPGASSSTGIQAMTTDKPFEGYALVGASDLKPSELQQSSVVTGQQGSGYGFRPIGANTQGTNGTQTIRENATSQATGKPFPSTNSTGGGAIRPPAQSTFNGGNSTPSSTGAYSGGRVGGGNFSSSLNTGSGSGHLGGKGFSGGSGLSSRGGGGKIR